MRFHSYPAPPSAIVSNVYGYAQTVPAGSWLVGDEHGQPLRVHNGFAFFTTKAQADWCAEMMNSAFRRGKEAAQAEIRVALGIVDHADASQ